MVYLYIIYGLVNNYFQSSYCKLYITEFIFQGGGTSTLMYNILRHWLRSVKIINWTLMLRIFAFGGTHFLA